MWIIINPDGSCEYPLGENDPPTTREERREIDIRELPELQIVPTTPEVAERGAYIPYPDHTPPPLRRIYEN